MRSTSVKAPVALARPFFDKRENEAVSAVLASGWLMQGERVREFEAKLSEYTGATNSIAVSSGTAALHIAFSALGIGQNDRVYIPSFGWPSAANISLLLGARPVLIDSSLSDYNLDPAKLEQALKQDSDLENGRAFLIPIHQFGAPCDMDEIDRIAKQSNTVVFEDSACALGTIIDGRHVGLQTAGGIFSFHPRKIITTGEGGAIITNDSEFAVKCRALRNHGEGLTPGLNYRMTDMQAAIGCVQMEKLPEIIERRARLVALYSELLSEINSITLPDYLSNGHSVNFPLQTLMVIVDSAIDRDHLIRSMREDEIEASIGSVAAHDLSYFRSRQEPDLCPNADILVRQGVALPLHAGMTEPDVHCVVECLTRSISGEIA